MAKLLAYLAVAVVALTVLEALVPLVLAAAHALVPVVLVAAVVLVVLRVVWYLTGRH